MDKPAKQLLFVSLQFPAINIVRNDCMAHQWRWLDWHWKISSAASSPCVQHTVFPHCLAQCPSKKHPVGKLHCEANFTLANKNYEGYSTIHGKVQRGKGIKTENYLQEVPSKSEKNHTLKKQRHVNEVSKEIKQKEL